MARGGGKNGLICSFLITPMHGIKNYIMYEVKTKAKTVSMIYSIIEEHETEEVVSKSEIYNRRRVLLIPYIIGTLKMVLRDGCGYL